MNNTLLSKSKKNNTLLSKSKSKKDILFIFYKYFRVNNHKITFYYNEEHNTIYIEIYSSYDKSNPCIELNFTKTEMEIDYLSKCLFNESESMYNISKGVGNKSLKHLINIGSDLKLKKLILYDASNINISYIYNGESNKYRISLAIYKILIEGQSWYNKNGFKSINHEKEKIEWDKIRNEPFFITFLKFKDATMKKNITKLLEYKVDVTEEILEILDKYNELQTRFIIFFEENSLEYIHKVKDVFKLLDKQRLILEGGATVIDKKKADFYYILKELVKLFKNNINYTHSLVYTY